MAESFAVDPGGPVTAQGGGLGPVAVSASAARGGGSGGTTFWATDKTAEKTHNLLMNLAGAALAPHIKEASQAQFLSGLQRAAGGDGLQDILKDQPWYTEIFGKSSASMGARTYTAQANIAKFGAEMEKAMPKLAKGGPEEMMKFASGAIKDMMTGDTTTDNNIMGAFAEQLQPLFKRHAKENYIYTQKQANAAQVASWDALMDGFQQQAKAATNPEGGVTPEDLRAAETRLIGHFLPFADQSDESHATNLMHVMQGAAAKGNFQAIKLMEREGILKSMPPEMQARLEGTFKQAGQRALNNAIPEYSLEMAMMVNDTAQDPRGIAERVQKFNKRVAEATGVDERYGQMIPNQSIDNITGNVLRAQAAADARGLTLTPEQKREQQLATARAMIPHKGALANSVATSRIPDNVAAEAMLGAWEQDATPQGRAKLLDVVGPAVSTIKNQLESLGITDKENTKGVEHVAAIHAMASDGAKGKYFSADLNNFYGRYNASVRAGVPPEQAFQSAKVTQPLSEDMLSAKDKSDMGKAVRMVAEERNENFLGWNKVSDQSLRIIEAMIAKNYKKNLSVYPSEVSARMAYSAALEDGLEVLGHHAIIGRNVGEKNVVDMMLTGKGNMGRTETAEAFDRVLKEKAQAVGGKLDNYTIMRTRDLNGEPRLLIQMIDKEGGFHTSYINGEDLRRKPAAPKPEAGTPYIGYRNPRRQE